MVLRPRRAKAGMPSTTTAARTGICEKCQARLTHLLTLHSWDDHDEPPPVAPFSCPNCGHAGTVAVQTGAESSGLIRSRTWSRGGGSGRSQRSRTAVLCSRLMSNNGARATLALEDGLVL